MSSPFSYQVGSPTYPICDRAESYGPVTISGDSHCYICTGEFAVPTENSQPPGCDYFQSGGLSQLVNTWLRTAILRNGKLQRYGSGNQQPQNTRFFHLNLKSVIHHTQTLRHLVALQVALPLCTRATLKACKAEVQWRVPSHLWKVPFRHLADHSLMYRSDLLPPTLIAECQCYCMFCT